MAFPQQQTCAGTTKAGDPCQAAAMTKRCTCDDGPYCVNHCREDEVRAMVAQSRKEGGRASADPRSKDIADRLTVPDPPRTPQEAQEFARWVISAAAKGYISDTRARTLTGILKEYRQGAPAADAYRDKIDHMASILTMQLRGARGPYDDEVLNDPQFLRESLTQLAERLERVLGVDVTIEIDRD